jgi:hypothetical protein
VQMVGPGAGKRIDAITAALYGRWAVDDSSRRDLSCALPYAPMWNPEWSSRMRPASRLVSWNMLRIGV